MDTSDHVRPPQQERSRKTLERILDAAMEIIDENGVQAATVSAVVERAGSSVGSFYARFEGKEDLLRYLEERVWTEARLRWEEARDSQAWEELDLEGVVRSLVRFLVRIRKEDAGSRRALGRAGPDGRLGEEARRFHGLVEEEVAGLMLHRKDAIGHPQPERAIRVAYRWAVGGIRELLREVGPVGGSEPRSGGRPLSPEQVIEEVTRGLVAYLAGGIEAQPESNDVEFFDVWQ